MKAGLKACPICSYRVLFQSFSSWQVIKCNFLDFNFFVPVCLFVCLFYFDIEGEDDDNDNDDDEAFIVFVVLFEC